MKRLIFDRKFYTYFLFALVFLAIGVFLKNTQLTNAQTSPVQVAWTNLVNATANGNNIQHSGSNSGYFAKGQTTQTISGVGFFEFTFQGEICVVGLGNNNDENNDGSFNDLDFAFNFGSTNSFSIRKNGNYLGEGSAVNGDIFRIEVSSNGNAVFSKNGNPICSGSTCSFSNPQNYPYYLVFKAYEYTGRISNAAVSSNSGGGSIQPPTSLQAANGGGNTINLSWQYNSSNISGFKVERKLGTQGSYTEIATVSSSLRTYSDTSEKPSNRPFVYRIRAFSNTTNSNYSNEVGAVTPYTGNASIITNKDYLPPSVQAPPLPLAGQKFIDETFGTQIMRLTDESDGYQAAIGSTYPEYPVSFSVAYSVWGSFNHNNTRIFIIDPAGGGGYFLKFDPITFQRQGGLLGLANTPDGALVTQGLVWSRNDPDVFYSVVGKKLYQGRIVDQNTQSPFQFTVIKDFSNEINDLPIRDSYLYKLSISDDSDDVFWLQARKSEPFYGSRQRMGTTIIAYKKSQNVIIYRRDFCTDTTVNCVDENKGSVIDKTGRILSNLNQTYPSANSLTVFDPEIIDLANNNSSTTVPNQSPYYTYGHADLGRGKAVGWDGQTNKIKSWDLVESPHRAIDLFQFRDWSQDSHFSMLAQNDGWALVSPYVGIPASSTNNEPIKNEIFQIKTDGSSKIRRLAHHFSNSYPASDECNIPGFPSLRQHGCYFAQPHSNISRDGRFIAFSSNWGNRSGRVDVFIAKILPASRSPFGDFEGDDATDYSTWRPSNNTWYIQNSSSGNLSAVTFGLSGDKPVPSDYDGDGKTDIAVWRPSSGVWHIIKSSDNGYYAVSFGLNGDKPLPGDFDGDGKTDLAVWRPSNGTWYIQRSSDATYQFTTFGINGDIPVHGNFDGDNKQDIAVFRPSNGVWYITRSTDQSLFITQFGLNGDVTIPNDYDGDGKTDIAVWRQSNNVWYLLQSTKGFAAVQFGVNTDIPVPADYDGDTLADIAVFRNGTWYVLNSSIGNISTAYWGTNGDIPIQSVNNSQ
jgi:hypothetical protein